MLWNKSWLVLFLINANAEILCYNCSSTHRDYNHCEGDFAPFPQSFNATKNKLINCSGENAMCFVRSWSARARYAWIVQRGCYQATAEDILPRTMNTPTRAMSCKLERYPDAEYKVCLCQADWCNSASTVVPAIIQYFTKIPRYIYENIVTLHQIMLRMSV